MKPPFNFARPVVAILTLGALGLIIFAEGQSVYYSGGPRDEMTPQIVGDAIAVLVMYGLPIVVSWIITERTTPGGKPTFGKYLLAVSLGLVAGFGVNVFLGVLALGNT